MVLKMKLSFLVLVMVAFLFSSSATAQTCNTQTFSNRLFASCNDLPQLSSYLHWTYFPGNATISVAYRAPLSSAGWVAWAINPNGNGMIGAEALVAIRFGNGSAIAYTTRVADYQPSMDRQDLTFRVTGLGVEAGTSEVTIFADVQLPGNRTSINHVWQQGPLSSGGTPAQHSLNTANQQSAGTLDLLSGQGSSSGAGSSIFHRRNVHGVLNAVSWGTLMPIGAIVARYMKVAKAADPAWFYLHAACQTSAYVVGVAGWGTGLKLGSDSKGITHDTHRRIGIALFALGTLQVFALLLRPKKDHKYRMYWNAYHHTVGYTVIVLSVINIYKGFDILDPEKKWKRAYTGVIIGLGALAVVLEAVTWPVVINRRRKSTGSGV